MNGTAKFDGPVTFAGGVNATTSFNLGGQPFAFGSPGAFNAFLGFAGNSTSTGTDNTGSGVDALYQNTTGSDNTASGFLALGYNTTGKGNTALGSWAGGTILGDPITGSNNTAIGYGAGFSGGTLSNATAIGAAARVDSSNALVLGSINGVNGATASTNVGIGTTTPTSPLTVVGTIQSTAGGFNFPDNTVQTTAFTGTAANGLVTFTSPMTITGNAATTNTLTISGGQNGVNASSSNSLGTGVVGLATSSTGSTNGVFGRSDSSSGTGVSGAATSLTGSTNGVYGQSNSNAGYGVFGSATSSTGTNYGVYGQSNSASGYGTYGSGPSFGTYGSATATSGVTYGVKGQSASSAGAGVYGTNSSTSGTAVGVWGVSPSSGGIGISGQATSTSGSTVGVYGWSGSNTGTGVLGGGATGVYGSSSQYFSTSQPYAGVVGYNNIPATSGVPVGVFGYAVGSSNDTNISYGVIGQADGKSGTAVLGSASGSFGRGVRALAGGTNGVGVEAFGGLTGVAGISYSSSGAGGVFQNTAGGELISGQNCSGSRIEVFSVDGNGGAVIDKNSANAGAISPGLTFGNASGEGIASQRTSGTGQYGIDFYTSGHSRMTLANNSYLGIGTRSPNALLTVGTPLSGTMPGSTFNTNAGSLGTSYGNALTLATIGFTSTNATSLNIKALRDVKRVLVGHDRNCPRHGCRRYRLRRGIHRPRRVRSRRHWHDHAIQQPYGCSRPRLCHCRWLEYLQLATL